MLIWNTTVKKRPLHKSFIAPSLHIQDNLLLRIKKTPLGETGHIGILFLRPLPCVTSTPPQLLRPVRISTSYELYPDTGFSECLSSQFFNSPAPMLLTGRHATSVVTRCFPPLPKEAEDFPRGEKYFRHMPPLTYLIYFSPKGLY